MTKTFYIETQETSREEITETLRSAGLKATEIREVTQNQNGIIFTNTLIRGIWSHETGQAGCKATDTNPCNHREWADLSEQQQESFTICIAEFMEQCRQDEFIAKLALEDNDEFEKVRLNPCSRRTA